MRWPEVTDPRVFDALLELYRQGLDAPEQAVLEHGLEAAVSCTDSRFGYLHFVNDDQRTLELATWSRQTRDWCQAQYDSHYPLDAAGVWADAARFRTPQIHNDLPALSHRRGYPDGHVKVFRHLCVPVLEGDQVRALLGVANRGPPYGDDQVLVLQNFADVIWRLVAHRRQWERLLLDERRLSDLRSLWPVCAWERHAKSDALRVDSRFDAVVAHSEEVPASPATVAELLAYIHPADRPLVAELFDDPPEDTDLRLPLRGLRADGTGCRLLLQVLSRRDPRRPTVSLYGTLQDVTDREEVHLLRC